MVCHPLTTQVVDRVQRKAATYGQDVEPDADSNGASKPLQCKCRPEAVAALYDEWVMPLTKKVQVAYLLRRLEIPQ
jgi:chorismate mutase